MSIKIRVDDFPYTKREERDRHNLKAFAEFQDVINRWCNGYWLLGAIPGNCDSEAIDFLRWKLNGARVGMHGINHNERLPNEFAPYLTVDNVREQLRLTRELFGRAIDKDVRVYMPPHNVIDTRTVSVLRDAGFRAFTGGPETESQLRQPVEGVQYLHSEPPHEYGRSDEMLARNSVAHLIRESAERDVWLTLHWTWETNIGLRHLDKFLSEIEGSLSLADVRF